MVVVAPAAQRMPMSANTHSYRVLHRIATRSSFCSPIERRAIETARVCSLNCFQETVFHPEPTGYEKAVLSGVAAIRPSNISGTV